MIVRDNFPLLEEAFSSMKKSWQCIICGYVHVGEHPPDSCQICGASRDEFKEIFEKEQVPPATSPAYWRCINCEFIHQGDEPPRICAVCGADRDSFSVFEPSQNSSVSAGSEQVVIIGGGIAGLTAAEELRQLSPTVGITLITDENCLPYYRLNLTRYLAQAISKAVLEVHPAKWYDEHNITILTEKATFIDTANKTVTLVNNQAIPYDKLILAMGSHPFVPPIPGNNLPNVMTLRTIADASRIADKLSSIKSCICIGGGILGLEIAGAVAASGVHVTVLEGAEWLMPRQLNKAAAVFLTNFLETIGVHVRTGSQIKEISGSGQCEGVLLETGEFLPASLVLIAAGVRPNTHLARKAGLDVHHGLVINNYMQTSDPHIYAAGDISEHYGTLYGLWNIAQHQGKVAARNLLGHTTQFGSVPRSNVLKVLQVDLFSIGEITASDASYTQLEKQTGNQYYMFLLRDNKIAGSIILGDKAISLKVKQAVEKESNFSPEVIHNIDRFLNHLQVR